ncbi:MAG TPA: transcription antitermination factor NusB [Alphaproteobacteria bacterium]|nr:transcription antitermination factor NusB [Alphaproteobacteria bacterium]
MVERPDKSPAEGKSPTNVHRLSSARLAAVQAIYQMEMTGAAADGVVAEFLLHRGGAELGEGENAVEADKALFADIVHGVSAQQDELDRLIGSTLVEGWPLARIEKVMAAALRAGAYELLRRADVPARVVVSEYVDVAHAFFEGKEVGMVNGVLDRLARLLREAEMADTAMPDPSQK